MISDRWGARHLVKSPGASNNVRQRRPTAFLRPADGRRGGGGGRSTTSGRHRPRRSASSNVGGDSAGWIIEDGDEEEEEEEATGEVESPDGESTQKAAQSPAHARASRSPSHPPSRPSSRSPAHPPSSHRPSSVSPSHGPPSHSPPRPLSSSKPRRRTNKLKNLLIISDSSPSPDTPFDPSLVPIKVEPKDEEVASSKGEEKATNKSNPRQKGQKSKKERGKQQKKDAKETPLPQRIEEFLESISKEVDENGLVKCAYFLRNMEKSDFPSQKEWERYKKVVKSPISLTDILNQMKEYHTVAELSRDFMKLIQNARKVVAEGFQCLDHVEWLDSKYQQWINDE